jgi:single-strand DNA-binding protein
VRDDTDENTECEFCGAKTGKECEPYCHELYFKKNKVKTLNYVKLIGDLTRNPELRYAPNGDAVVSFGMHTGEGQKDFELHNVVAWRKLAEYCAQTLAKGKEVVVEGRLQTRSWEGQDGVKRYRTEIVADKVGPSVKVKIIKKA